MPIKGREAIAFSYLLGLLAKIKCSICSYQCENWYLLYGEVLFHINFFRGLQFKRSLAELCARVASDLHCFREWLPRFSNQKEPFEVSH